MSSELKLCPFCGSEAENTGPDKALVNCSSETCSMHWAWFKIEWWNRRAPSPAVKALVEACRAVIQADEDESEQVAAHGGYGHRPMPPEIVSIREALAAVEKEIQ